ncbi:MAG TPA: DoxX family protein [Cyclobacteriaceae bacterium]|nr:DoxX family protein [Cyclobacteriaceae bacterium]
MERVKSNSKGWTIALWISQVILAAMFIMAGLPKATTPLQELAATMPMAIEYPEALIRFIGISEVLAGIGLVVPGVLKIKTILIPLAALGLAVIMVLAIIFHLSRGEVAPSVLNLVLGLLASFVAWGRYWKAPIHPESKSTHQARGFN